MIVAVLAGGRGRRMGEPEEPVHPLLGVITALEALEPEAIEWDEAALRSVNTPEELAAARAKLA